MNQFISVVLKGVAMGAANVIPGVSGGTIALITGIYERLINAIKSIDHNAIKLFFSGRWQEMWTRVDGTFLTAVFIGVVVSIFSLARVLEFSLQHYEQATMGFFFGLILLSLLFVGSAVNNWSTACIGFLVLGAAVAVGIAVLAPASENTAFWYMFLCGVVAICSMILPGLSGSFILIIMGNYALVLNAINRLDMGLLFPLLLGCLVGLIAFSHFLAWVFARFHDQTIALMTGFILGSLAIIWPWKNTQYAEILREGKPPKEVVTGYEWYLPSLSNGNTWLVLAMMLIGAVTIYFTERFSRNQESL